MDKITRTLLLGCLITCFNGCVMHPQTHFPRTANCTFNFKNVFLNCYANAERTGNLIPYNLTVTIYYFEQTNKYNLTPVTVSSSGPQPWTHPTVIAPVPNDGTDWYYVATANGTTCSLCAITSDPSGPCNQYPVTDASGNLIGVQAGVPSFQYTSGGTTNYQSTIQVPNLKLQSNVSCNYCVVPY